MYHHILPILILCIVGCSASLPNIPVDRVSNRGVRTTCWTCSPGWVHWYDLGWTYPSNGDMCQCVRSSTPTTTTKTPTPTSYDTRGCWTCPAGQIHWFAAGFSSAPGGDQCGCVPLSSTKSPTTTTKAPIPTSYDTRGCWTCPAGQIHWFAAGFASAPGGDQCACVPLSSTNTPVTTTKLPTTTKAPQATTIKPTPYCWTCPNGYIHWFDAGLSSAPGGDQCACVKSSSATSTKSPTTTTKAPVTTTQPTPYCWTCPAGMKHWYELGMAQPTDQCACYADTAVTSAPGSPSTAAPSGSLMQNFINAMTPTTTSPGSISFSACVAPYAPWNPPPLNLMKQLLSNLVSTTNYRTIMVYSLDQYIAQVAASLGVKVLGIIYLTNDYTSNAANIANGVYAAKTYPDTVLAVACGNENGQNYGPTAQTASFINNCISSVKQAGVKQPVGCIDTPSSWLQSGGRTWSDVANNADWIGANIYPWFDNVYMNPPYTCKTPQNVGTYTYSMYQAIENAYPGKPVFLTESGWPSSPGGSTIRSTPNVVNGQQCTTAGDSDQRTGVQNIVNVFRQNKKPMNLFSGYKEAWKSSGNDYSVEEYWGVCSGSPPYACFNAPK